MITLCIHAFPTEQCAQCRTCPHGLTTSRCTRCRTASASAARRRVRPAPRPHATTSHNGFEIFFEPAVNGWLYRTPDAEPSPESYRSAFLARKAIDQLPAASTPDTSPSKRKR